jgi:hypothetical protein
MRAGRGGVGEHLPLVSEHLPRAAPCDCQTKTVSAEEASLVVADLAEAVSSQMAQPCAGKADDCVHTGHRGGR